MRFQQLKRDPNAVMRKKLVKSKKNWIVVSSLSIAGGLLLMSAPSYVAKADTTTESTTPSTVVASSSPASTETTTPSKDAAPADNAVVNEAPKQDDTPVNGSTDKGADTVTVDDKTADTDTTDKVAEPDSTVEKTDVAGGDVTGNLKLSALSAAAPASTTDTDPTATPVEGEEAAPETLTDKGSASDTDSIDGSVDTGKVDGQSDAAAKEDAADADKAGEQLEVSADALDATDPAAQLAAEDVVAPVAEDVVTKTNSGAGWTYDSDTTTLNINGDLTDFKGGDTEHWGGNTSDITTVNINKQITAPIDSSYMFANMTNLKTINNLSNLTFTADAEHPQILEGMFKNDYSIEDIDLSAANLIKAENISHMFENDYKLKTIEFSNTTGFKDIVNASFTFANCSSLVNLDAMTKWQASNATDLRGMFKNASSLKKLSLGVLNWSINFGKTNTPTNGMPNTGDSSIGEGMFDGTNLDSITMPQKLYFSPGTALTSSLGSKWVSDQDNKQFLGVPTFDDSGNATGGLSSLYNGNVVSDSILLKYTPQGASTDETITNLVTIKTNQPNMTITVPVTGTVGQTVTNIKVPSIITFDGKKYTTDPNQLVSATLGQTMATANETITYSREKATGKKGVSIPTNITDQNITIDIPDGEVGVTKQITLTSDNLPTGYEIKDGSVNTISVTYNGDSDTSPYTFSPNEIELVGVTNDESTVTVTNPDGSTSDLTIPEGNYGNSTTVYPDPISGYDT
ncbi:hypothetical protein, partial [Companilactobacillus sp. HBUAS59699]|uniref:hypothetical protein n=1 Tax=Companilactobacillus sp. HBUAS59699 TaxID=3109358 RepID=UPI002FEF3D40